MPNIIPKPIALNDVTVKVAADNYEQGVHGVTLTPTTASTVYKGMTPDAVFPMTGSTSWVLSIDHAQDHETEDSLTLFMLEHRGQRKTFEVAPKRGGASYKIDAICMPGAIGGQVDSTAVASIQLPCFGQPVRTPGTTP